MSERTDWIARVYKEDDEPLTAWLIYDRTEKEARDEAEADITNAYPGRDWTLSRAGKMDGGQIKIEIVGSIWIETHAEAEHDVLWNDVRYALMSEWDFEGIEKAVKKAIRDHLAERGVPGDEIDAFEEYLDIGGQTMVEVEIDVK